MNRNADPVTSADLEHTAAAIPSAEIWDFIAGGSGAETTLHANRIALDEIFLLPRVLRDVSACSPAVT
ncbi:alpha-hydroxy-acid oxidizing protein [Dactylosporangium sp. CA-233914]|uniref:alpha-hydroxy-acid oxidizing protein n=1 Tax=Dactylosporangium sp. CA-233914 TaxID=3239934 RepID=UPI003D915D54